MQEPSDLPARASAGDPGLDPPTAEPLPASSDPSTQWREEILGERNDGEYRTTFYVYKNDQQISYYLERIFNLEGKMVRMVKRAAEGRSETRFDPKTGDIERIFEAYTLADGNHLSKEKRYLDHDSTTESVLVVCPKNSLVRAVLREAKGLVNTFQGQTEFATEGYATISVNHWFDAKTTKMTKREQIQWLQNGERGVTENFYFDHEGCLVVYHKHLYHPGTDRFLEEIHHYEEHTQKLRRKEVKTYERSDQLANLEITTFDLNGEIIARNKSFVARNSGRTHS